MKLKYLIYIASLFLIPLYSSGSNGDTVIIELDNNTRIIILVDSPEDLKDLENYDINAMLRDLNMSIDSSDADTKYLVIEDDTGDNYLSDTTGYC